MAGVSTGVSLLKTGATSQRLIDLLEDYWELTNGTSVKGVSIESTGMDFNATSTNGTPSSALRSAVSSGFSRAGLHSLPSPADPLIKERTLIAWSGGTENFKALISSGGGSVLTRDFFNSSTGSSCLGLDIGGKSIMEKSTSANLQFLPLPAFTYPKNSINTYDFIAMTWEYTTLPTQKFTIYNGSGIEISSLTVTSGTQFSQRLCFMGAKFSGNLDLGCSLSRVSTYSKKLSPAQISFLYNSGVGRVYSEIEAYNG